MFIAAAHPIRRARRRATLHEFPRSHRTCIARRGGILFEIVLALSLFTGAAAFTLASVRSVYRTLDHTRRQQEAIDLARSRMAELDAGLINLADLRGSIASINAGAAANGAAADDRFGGGSTDRTDVPAGWVIEVKTHRTEFTGLSLVELTVHDAASLAANAAASPASRGGEQGVVFTLRQLVRLREIDAEAFEQDDLLQGLDPAEDRDRSQP